MSRFDGMFAAKKKVAVAPPGVPPAPAAAAAGPAAVTPRAGGAVSAPAADPPPAPPAPPPPRGPGRPRGKKSDPAYEQITAYVPRELYGKVRGELWNNHDRKEFSTLVTELMSEWLKFQKSS